MPLEDTTSAIHVLNRLHLNSKFLLGIHKDLNLNLFVVVDGLRFKNLDLRV